MDNIRPCNCKNDYQDAEYGKNMRVCTPSNKGNICTVCNANLGGGAQTTKGGKGK